MLVSAIKLVATHGSRVSMMAIGQDSGFSHGLVLARFGSKAGLIEAITKRIQDRFVVQVVAATGDKEGMDALIGLIEVFFEEVRENSIYSQAFSVLLGEAQGPDRQLQSTFIEADAAFRRYLQGLIKRARELGQIGFEGAVDALAGVIAGMVRGTLMQLRINRDAFDLDEAYREIVHILERMRLERQGIPECPSR